MTDDAMRPHPGGLAGRAADALDDLELLEAEHADAEAKRWAETKAAALVAALRAEARRSSASQSSPVCPDF